VADPIRIRVHVAGGNATVRVLMSHPMESGHRKDTNGQLIPAWHITDVTATHNAQPVLTAEWGTGVSKNPFLQFVVKGAKVGDTIGISWKDTAGDTRTDEVSVS
jgi:sulfur-oxidizing protein SoxZ